MRNGWGRGTASEPGCDGDIAQGLRDIVGTWTFTGNRWESWRLRAEKGVVSEGLRAGLGRSP